MMIQNLKSQNHLGPCYILPHPLWDRRGHWGPSVQVGEDRVRNGTHSRFAISTLKHHI